MLLASSAAQLLASDEGDVRRLSQVQLFLKNAILSVFQLYFSLKNELKSYKNDSTFLVVKLILKLYFRSLEVK